MPFQCASVPPLVVLWKSGLSGDDDCWESILPFLFTVFPIHGLNVQGDSTGRHSGSQVNLGIFMVPTRMVK